jgi:hypothetical protein
MLRTYAAVRRAFEAAHVFLFNADDDMSVTT